MFQKSKHLLIGLVAGLIIATATFAIAANPIKLIVNGREIQCDVPPQNINGRVLVPARFVAESLGASVAWDGAKNAVVITSSNTSELDTKIPQNSGIIQPEKEGKNITETTFEGMRAIKVDGVIYFSITDWFASLSKEGKTTSLYFEKNPFQLIIDSDTVMIPKTDYIVYNNIAYINSKYFNH
jgi:hypothetical protein